MVLPVDGSHVTERRKNGQVITEWETAPADKPGTVDSLRLLDREGRLVGILTIGKPGDKCDITIANDHIDTGVIITLKNGIGLTMQEDTLGTVTADNK